MAVPGDARDRLQGGGLKMAAVPEDPFAHLHDEAYAAPLHRFRRWHRDLISLAGRPTESLCGEWRMTLDLFDEGLRQKWYALDDTPPSQWAVPRDYEAEAGTKVPVPSCWNLLRDEWRYFEGAAWYARDIGFQPGPAGERQFLHFEGVAHAALVFVNGICVGGHLGGSTPFSCEIGGALQAGSNRILVMVENRRRPERVPMDHFDWFNYGGIHREVFLVRVPPVFLRRVGISLASDAPEIEIVVELSDPADGTARVAIAELAIDAPVAIRAGQGRARIPATPALWSPATPRLYDVEVGFGADRLRERVGFRRLAVDGTRILLNGAPVFLRGACVHEDDLALGRVTSAADIGRRLAHARELGANFLRLAHYPHHPDVARMADEAGILLWAEIPVYWAIDFASPATYADALNQLLELIARDGNRASVAIWGIGNENADTEARFAFMAGLARAARAADPTRLVAAACLINRRDFSIADRLADELDVIGLNEYFGWYEPDFSGLERLIENSDPGKPVVVSEAGADALAGHRGAGRILFTEDWQAEFHRRQFEIVSRVPWMAGYAAWLLYDFRSERRQTGFQRGFNRKGLIAADKTTRKAAFGTLAAAFRRHAGGG
jgi:beta-glucuronidase